MGQNGTSISHEASADNGCFSWLRCFVVDFLFGTLNKKERQVLFMANKKLKVCSLSLVVLMLFQLCFFCPCTYAGYNELMRVLDTGENLTVADIEPIVEGNPALVNETHREVYEDMCTVLYYALCRGENTIENRVAIAQYLIEKGASVGPIFEGGITPLHWAAEGGHEFCVKLLLERDADPNCESKRHETPLYEAARNGHEACVRLLLEGVLTQT